MPKKSDQPQDKPLGNKDPNRRGRGPKDAIGQNIPEKVKDQIKPKREK